MWSTIKVIVFCIANTKVSILNEGVTQQLWKTMRHCIYLESSPSSFQEHYRAAAFIQQYQLLHMTNHIYVQREKEVVDFMKIERILPQNAI